MEKIEIYTIKGCPFCEKALKLLKEKNLDFKQIDITSSKEDSKEKLAQYYNIKGPVTVPQIIIDGKRIGGYSDLIKLDEFKSEKVEKSNA